MSELISETRMLAAAPHVLLTCLAAATGAGAALCMNRFIGANARPAQRNPESIAARNSAANAADQPTRRPRTT